MTPAQALAFVRWAVAGNRIEFSMHALEESMPDDKVTIADVRHVLENATTATRENDTGTKWKLIGPIQSHAPYAVVCAFKQSKIVVVVTSHDPP